MNKSNNITREEMWAKQCLSATDIDYAVWAVSYTHLDVYKRQVRLIGHITKPELGCALITRDGQEFELKAQGWNPLKEDKQ